MQVQPNIVIPQLITAFKQGSFSHVIQFVEQSPVLTKVDPVVVQLYGSALRKMGKLQEASKAFEKGIRKFPQASDLLNSFGNLLLELENAPQAIIIFKKALQINAAAFDYKYNLARALCVDKKYSEAETLCQQLLSIRPSHSSLLILNATIASEKGNAELAENYLLSVFEFDESNVIALNNLGNLNRQKGRLDKAIQYYERALKAGGRTPQLYQNLAAAAGLKNSVSEALAFYQEGLIHYPLNIALNIEYAHFAWIKNVAAPFEYLEKHLSLNNPDLVLAYCEMMLRIGEVEKAYFWLIHLVDGGSSHLKLSATANLCNALRDLGKFEDALSASENGLKKLNSDAVPLLVEKGYALLSLQRNKEAAQVFEKVCRLSPLNQGYWTLLSTAYKANGSDTKYISLCDYKSFVHATPLLLSEHQNKCFTNDLAAYLSTLHGDERHPIGQSLRNGSQTFENLLESDNALVQLLKKAISDRATAFITSLEGRQKHPFLSRLSTDLSFIGSWSVRLRKAGFHKSHYHSEGWLSGVFYVEVPNETNHNGNGWLCFGRPDINGVSLLEDYAIKPEPGIVVFFPSYLWHGTNAIQSDSPRMTVAFDIIPN